MHSAAFTKETFSVATLQLSIFRTEDLPVFWQQDEVPSIFYNKP